MLTYSGRFPFPSLFTFVDVDFQDLLLSQDLAPAAGFAAVLVADALALALAALAHGPHLLHHARPQLVEAHLHAGPAAGHADLHGALPTAASCGETSTSVLAITRSCSPPSLPKLLHN